MPAIDAALGGGLRRGHLSELVGGRSSGRTSLVCRALGAAVDRGELVALVDTCDRFDPASAAALGLDLSGLLWIRETGDATRALKAMNLVLQAGGFGLVVLDLADVPLRTVRALPFTTWFRLGRVIEGSHTVALLMAAEHVARSSGGATIAMQAMTEGTSPRMDTTPRPTPHSTPLSTPLSTPRSTPLSAPLSTPLSTPLSATSTAVSGMSPARWRGHSDSRAPAAGIGHQAAGRRGKGAEGYVAVVCVPPISPYA